MKNKRTTKEIALIITYIAFAVLFVINFKTLVGLVTGFLGLLSSFFVGIAIAFILNNPCMAIERVFDKHTGIKKRSIKRGLSISLTYMLLLMLISLLIRFVIPQLFQSVQGLINDLGTYFNNLQKVFDNIANFFKIDPIDLTDLSKFISNSVEKLIDSVSQLLSQIIAITTNVISVIINLFVSLVFSIYFLADKEKMLGNCKKIFKTYLSSSLYEKASYVYNIIVDIFNKYIIGQATEALILGSLCFVGMIIFRFDYPLLISVIIGVLALVPIVGAYLGGFISLLLILLISPIQAVWFGVFLVVLQQFEGNVIYPRVVGSSVGLPSIWVLLSIIVGGGLAGPLGVLLGVPVASVVYTLLKNDVRRRNKMIED